MRALLEISKDAARAGSTLLLGLGLAACRDAPHAWEVTPDAAPGAASAVTAVHYTPPSDGGIELAGDASLLAEAGSALAFEDAGNEIGPPETPVRVGGPWVRCYGNFKASGDPLRDVTRLGLLCGPENGMRRIGDRPVEGSVVEGGAAATSTFAAKRGECYRVFAVADRGVTDLDVSVESSRGVGVAADHGEDGWPIVQPDRPFCPLEDDALTLRITARKGSGRFAVEVWRLATPAASDRRLSP